MQPFGQDKMGARNEDAAQLLQVPSSNLYNFTFEHISHTLNDARSDCVFGCKHGTRNHGLRDRAYKVFESYHQFCSIWRAVYQQKRCLAKLPRGEKFFLESPYLQLSVSTVSRALSCTIFDDDSRIFAGISRASI